MTGLGFRPMSPVRTQSVKGWIFTAGVGQRCREYISAFGLARDNTNFVRRVGLRNMSDVNPRTLGADIVCSEQRTKDRPFSLALKGTEYRSANLQFEVNAPGTCGSSVALPMRGGAVNFGLRLLVGLRGRSRAKPSRFFGLEEPTGLSTPFIRRDDRFGHKAKENTDVDLDHRISLVQNSLDVTNSGTTTSLFDTRRVQLFPTWKLGASDS